MSDEKSAKPPMQERLNLLGAKFLQRTVQEVASLRECLAQIPGGDAHALKQMQHLAHKIHGTGGALGFDSISDCAGVLERVAGELAAGTPADLCAIEYLAQSLGRLASEVERSVKARGLE